MQFSARHESFGTTKQKVKGLVWLCISGHEVTELVGKSNPNFANTKIIVRKDSWKKIFSTENTSGKSKPTNSLTKYPSSANSLTKYPSLTEEEGN